MRKRPKEPPALTGAVPTVLRLGRCIEVWGSPDAEWGMALSAFRRFSVARDGWLAEQGITEVSEQCSAVPLGGPWSVRGPAGGDQLARVGATVDDLDALAVEADRMVQSAAHAQAPRRRG